MGVSMAPQDPYFNVMNLVNQLNPTPDPNQMDAVAKMAQQQPLPPTGVSGNIIDNLKRNEAQQIIQDLIEFKRDKDAGKFTEGFKPSPEKLQEWHKTRAPHLSNEEFDGLMNLYKEAVSPQGPGGNPEEAQAGPAQPQTAQPQPTQAPLSQALAPPTEQPYTRNPEAPQSKDFTNLSDVLVAALSSLGHPNPNQGELLNQAMQNKISSGMKGVELANEAEARKMANQERLDVLKERADANKQIQIDRDLDRAQRDKTATEALAEKIAARLSREEDTRARLAQTAQFHADSQSIKEQMLELAKTKAGKIPPGRVKEVSDKTQAIARFAELATGFEDKYGGSYMFGPTMTALKERTGTKVKHVNWWKEFKMMDAKLRYDLFGGTLTQGEKQSWDSITVNENSDPAIIKAQLIKRANIARDALNRDLDDYESAGYTVGIDELRGKIPPEKGAKVPNPSAPSAFIVGKSYTDANGRNAKYLGKRNGKDLWQVNP